MTEVSNYSRTSIHYDMLTDTSRTTSYMDAILGNKDFFKDKVVCDVGCGTGILSLFAAKAGAKKVYAIECTKIADTCQKIISDNGYEDVIQIMRGKSDEIELPEKVDIIISEWMGYSLYYERMLPAVLIIRDKYLKEGGCILPSEATLYINICHDPEYRTVNLGYWDSTYDFDFKAMKELSFTEPVICKLRPSFMLARGKAISSINMHTCKDEDMFIKNSFTFVADTSMTIDAFVTYFEVAFNDMEKKVILSTSPFANTTHWMNTAFYLKEPFDLKKGEQVDGIVEFLPNTSDPAGLIVKFIYRINNKIIKSQTFDFSF